MSLELHILGSGGGAPASERETACYLVRNEAQGLLIDVGSGGRRLASDPRLLDGVADLQVVLTHFHYDHICWLPFLRTLNVSFAIWAPGRWLYGQESKVILGPLRRPPIAPSDYTNAYTIRELEPGEQEIAGLRLLASPQLNHWSPSAGLRIEDALALVTDTPYEASNVMLAAGVTHLFHEAWSTSADPVYREHDATAADAARVASQAGVERLTLIHLSPEMTDPTALLVDAATEFEDVTLGQDGAMIRLDAPASAGVVEKLGRDD